MPKTWLGGGGGGGGGGVAPKTSHANSHQPVESTVFKSYLQPPKKPNTNRRLGAARSEGEEGSHSKSMHGGGGGGCFRLSLLPLPLSSLFLSSLFKACQAKANLSSRLNPQLCCRSSIPDLYITRHTTFIVFFFKS